MVGDTAIGPIMNEPTRPRAEPEIIPPDRSSPHGRKRSRGATSNLWASVETGEGHRVYIAKPGPLGLILAAIAVGIVVGMTLLALLGVLLLSLPVIGAIVAALILSTIIRRYCRALR